jgi:hypothetical protein
MLFAVDFHKDFVNEERITVTAMPPLQSFRVESTEFDAPQSDGFVADSYTAFSQKVFDITVTEIESIVQPDSVADDIGREPVSFVGIHPEIIHCRELSCQYLERGKYFRIAADVIVDGENLADLLIEAGMAVRYDGGKKTKNWPLYYIGWFTRY